MDADIFVSGKKKMRIQISGYVWTGPYLNVYNYADILVEDVFRAIECRLAQMKVFSHYSLTFSANDCVFSLNEQQKV